MHLGAVYYEDHMDIHQIAGWFIREHQNATELVVDMKTGLPYKAVYSGVTCNGIKRVAPAVYYFEECLR